VYFDYDSFEVRGEYAATLEANARYLKANSSRKIALEGHTDARGGREYNLALGQKRAEAVRRSLSLMGVSESQMEPVSFGEEKPAALGMDEESYAKNRRVELTYR
jgi:peptidoglycan-associated lipoprotein